MKFGNILHFTGHVNTYPCLSMLALKLIHVRKWVLGDKAFLKNNSYESILSLLIFVNEKVVMTWGHKWHIHVLWIVFLSMDSISYCRWPGVIWQQDLLQAHHSISIYII